MSDARDAMTTWVGTLTSGGILRNQHEEAGITVAAYVVGEEQMGELRRWMLQQSPEILEREQRAAIEVCIWLANADREIDPEEVFLLKKIISSSHLSDDIQDELVAEVHDPPSLRGIEKRLSHPVLRELMIALMWELADSDGFVDKSEEDFLTGLCKRLEIAPERTSELRQLVLARLSAPPQN